MKLVNPHPYHERLLVFGGGGAGKTNVGLSIANVIADGEMHVVETDISAAWQRAIYTDFPEVEDRVHVHETEPEWESWYRQLAQVVNEADPDDDWITIDSITPAWDMVQNWYLAQIYGDDLPSHLIALKKEYLGDAKGYGRAVLEDMNWSAVKKEYAARVMRPLQKWKGHLLLTAEAKSVGDRDSEDVQMTFGPVGAKPAGEGRLMYLGATNILLQHPKRGVWTMTTVKDRNREEVDREPVGDFGVEYLGGIAGWMPVKKARS